MAKVFVIKDSILEVDQNPQIEMEEPRLPTEADNNKYIEVKSKSYTEVEVVRLTTEQTSKSKEYSSQFSSEYSPDID